MLFYKSVFAFVLVGLSLFAVQREPAPEIRSKLFKHILTDYPELADCIKQEEGGVAAAEKEMIAEEVDLNGDGIKEYEVELPGRCNCGAQNCTLYLYRRSGQGFESILEGAAGLGVEFLKTSTNGYRDLRINAHDTAASESRTTYKFDGKQYREGQIVAVNLETGESKQSYGRVQFKRGTSSTTVQGNASLVLPDTYLVGARAGQVMTVQLTAARKSVRFIVMSPTTTSLVSG
jgi:hypothetical protein